MRYWDAVLAFLVAMVIAAVLTPLAAAFARRVGAVDLPSARGLSQRVTPRLGGLAILAGVLVAAAIWMPGMIRLARAPGTTHGTYAVVHTWAIIAGAVLIALVGAIDDVRSLPPILKLLGQIAAAVIAVKGGAVVTNVTLPFVGSLQLPQDGGWLTVIWLVALMNVVNFSDGIDGLAAGVCTIDGIAFAVIAFDLQGGSSDAAVLAALTAGAALGFLFHNFYPAKVFMGDSGANLLGYLLGVVAVIGSLKTNVVVALAVPLLILAVPFLDTVVRDRQAPQVRAGAMVGGRLPLPSPDGEDRIQSAQDGRLPVRLDADACGRRDRTAVRALLRPSGALQHRLERGDGVDPADGAGRERLSRLRARDLQVQGDPRDPVAQA